jgi:hypothetical protein
VHFLTKPDRKQSCPECESMATIEAGE